jgi:hypothetical protein
MFPLYIDPGTGSALFSLLVGIASAVFFGFHAFKLKIKHFFTGGKGKYGSKHKFVIYAEDKRYWTLFKPVVEEFENKGIELLYLTSSAEDPVFSTNYKYIKPEYIGEGNKAFARLNFLSADFVLATTPGLDVYQWKRSKMVKHYSHLYHTPSEFAQCEMFGLDYFDSLLVNGYEYQEEHIRKLEKARRLPEKQIVTVGCTYLDEYLKKLNEIPKEENHVFTVLVSPSWSEAALLSRFGEKLLDPLIKTGWRIIIRPHPQSLLVEKEIINRLTAKYADTANLEWDLERDNIYSLKKADIMISDYSGIILDYMFLLNKPVFYTAKELDWRGRDAYDIYKDQDEIWTFRNLENTGIALEPSMFNELQEVITKASADSSLDTSISEIKNKAWAYQGEAGKKVADFMIKTTEGI